MGYRVVVAADSAGYNYKELIRQDLESDSRVDKVIDAGLSAGEDIDYPHIAVKAARIITSGQADRGIFVCGTGMGMAISANKVKGIRACTAHDSYSVERLVLSNNAQVLCLGARVIGPEQARRLASQFFGYTFDPSSHSKPKVDEISVYEAS
jgi:ribose 5-phosphate isomerase B